VLGVSLGWQAATQIGAFAAIGIVLAWRSPNIIEAVAKLTNVVLKHRVEMKRIPEKVKKKKENLAKKVENRTKGKKKP